MKKILADLKDHVREDFRWDFYLTFSLFIAICIYLNYRWDFEDSVIDAWQGTWWHPTFFFLFYAFAYLSVVGMYAWFYNKLALFRSPEFWWKMCLGLAFLSLRSGFPLMETLLNDVSHFGLKYWLYKLVKNLLGLPLVILPLLALWWHFDKTENHKYGLNAQKFTLRPYLILLGLMMPLVVGASFFENFNTFYPMYKGFGAHTYLGVGEWVTVAGYELAYGLNFIVVEYFFRGFLILGMVKFLGRGAVISMVSLYCFFHFGKPEGEAISSIFGGYILGIISLRSHSIWGGVMIHVGIAWLMELAAFLQQML
jgi:hypothetical protein